MMKRQRRRMEETKKELQDTRPMMKTMKDRIMQRTTGMTERPSKRCPPPYAHRFVLRHHFLTALHVTKKPCPFPSTPSKARFSLFHSFTLLLDTASVRSVLFLNFLRFLVRSGGGSCFCCCSCFRIRSSLALREDHRPICRCCGFDR